MSLQFTNIDDAFAPLSHQKRKKERKYQEDADTDIPPTQQHTGQIPTTPPQPIHTVDQPKSFADEIFAVQPYINNLFMLIVIGMLYDIRQAALDCKLHLTKQ